MCPGFDSRSYLQIWVESVVGSPGFSSPRKTNVAKFQIDLERTDTFETSFQKLTGSLWVKRFDFHLHPRKCQQPLTTLVDTTGSRTQSFLLRKATCTRKKQNVLKPILPASI